MRFVVLIQIPDSFECNVYGPYTTFKKAEGDAKAWDGVVLPLQDPSEHDFPQTQKTIQPNIYAKYRTRAGDEVTMLRHEGSMDTARRYRRYVGSNGTVYHGETGRAVGKENLAHLDLVEELQTQKEST